MSFFGLFGNGPYMAWPKRLNTGGQSTVLRNATYQVVASEHGLPMVQLDLDFQRWDKRGQPVSPMRQMFATTTVYRDWHPSMANPDMTVALLMDRSGSMSESFRDGHVYNICANVLNYLAAAGVGYDLVFYDDRYDFADEIKTELQLTQALNTHQPRGGTYITEALRQTIKRYKTKKGIYLIVITDGAFQDKANVQNYILQELLPQLTPENPYAIRLHLVGAGEGADEQFLHQIENLASGKGVQLVTSHHHAHLSHAHDGILDELDRSFIGGGRNFFIEERVQADAQPVVTRIGNVVSREWYHGSSAQFPFMPRHALIGLEFKQMHPPQLGIHTEWHLAHSDDKESAAFRVPMPKVVTAGVSPRGAWKNIFAWTGQTPEETLAREALEKRAVEVHEAELERQSIDLVELGRGGIPVQAQARLKELGQSADEEGSFFTSNLAPDEIALLRKHGYKVRGLVTGSAMYHVGQAYASAAGDCQVKELTYAYDQATHLALSRMQQELVFMHAQGAVGVRLNLVRHEWGEKTIEVQAFGTAVDGPNPGKAATPWLSDLSGQEWFALHRAGYEPVALVYGHCTWFILTTAQDFQIEQSWTNRELTHWSEALTNARNIAMHTVQTQTKEAGGTGVAGVRISRRLDHIHIAGAGTDQAYSRQHHNLVISVIGTAIRLRYDAPMAIPATRYVLSLRDGRLKPVVVRQQADLVVE